MQVWNVQICYYTPWLHFIKALISGYINLYRKNTVLNRDQKERKQISKTCQGLRQSTLLHNHLTGPRVKQL